jgi:tetratricopeptide (TPR) repeat protein
MVGKSLIAGVLLLGIAVVGTSPSLAASKRDHEWCASPTTPATSDRNIAACTRIINDPKESERSKGEAYNNRAWEYLKAGKAAEGLPDVERSLKSNPNYGPALDTRGHIFEALGRREEAIADFRRALKLDPSRATKESSGAALKRLGATP